MIWIRKTGFNPYIVYTRFIFQEDVEAAETEDRETGKEVLETNPEHEYKDEDMNEVSRGASCVSYRFLFSGLFLVHLLFRPSYYRIFYS